MCEGSAQASCRTELVAEQGKRWPMWRDRTGGRRACCGSPQRAHAYAGWPCCALSCSQARRYQVVPTCSRTSTSDLLAVPLRPRLRRTSIAASLPLSLSGQADRQVGTHGFIGGTGSEPAQQRQQHARMPLKGWFLPAGDLGMNGWST